MDHTTFDHSKKIKNQSFLSELNVGAKICVMIFVLQRLAMQVGDWVVCRLYQRKRRARNQTTLAKKSKKSWDFKNELGLELAQTTSSCSSSSSSSCSSGITEISSSDLDVEASS